MTTSQDEIVLNRSAIVRVLTAIALFLLLASIAGQFAQYVLAQGQTHELIRIVNVDLEGNIPTLFSSFILFLACLLLALISTLKKESHDPQWRHWAILSLALLYMAIDEGSRIHELLNGPARSLLGQHANGIFTHAWVIFGISLILIFTLSYLRFFFSLPRNIQKQFLRPLSLSLAAQSVWKWLEDTIPSCMERTIFNTPCWQRLKKGLKWEAWFF